MEHILLGSILSDAGRELASLLASFKSSFFSDGRHRRIWEAAQELQLEGKPYDMACLADRLRAGDPDWFKEGKATELVDLLGCVPGIGHAEHAAERVRDTYHLLLSRRVLMATLEKIEGERTTGPAVVEAIGRLLTEILAEDRTDLTVPVEEAMHAFLDVYELRKAGKVPVIYTGFRELDMRVQGFEMGEFVLLAGRPSMGKTSMAAQFCVQIAQAGHPVGFVTMETTYQRLAEVMAVQWCKLDGMRVRAGTLTDTEAAAMFDAARALAELPIIIKDTPSRTIGQVSAISRQLRVAQHVEAIIIDHIHIMAQEGDKDEQRVVSEISKGLKSLAKELRIPVIALSQLSRAVESREGHRPGLGDLRWSGSLEQDADVILFPFRPLYYEPERAKELRGPERAETIVAKRRNGAIGTAAMEFRAYCSRFDDVTV